VARGTAEDTETTKERLRARFMTRHKAMLGDCVAITEAAVEQTGQMCEAQGVRQVTTIVKPVTPEKQRPKSKIRGHVCREVTCI